MKCIWLFTDTYLPIIDGVSIALKNQISILSKYFQIIVFYPDINNEIKYNNNSIVISLKSISILPMYSSYRAIISLHKKFINKIYMEYPPNLIHIATPIFAARLGFYYSKKYFIPSVASYPSNVDSQISCIFPYPFSFFIKKYYYFWIKNYYKHFNRVVFPCVDLINTLNLNQNTKCTYIPNSINNIFFSRNKIINNERKDLVCLGRLSKEKNVEFIINCLALINIKHLNLKLHIVGDGPEKRNLINLSKKLNIIENIVFHGWCTNNQIVKIFKLSSIMVHACVFETQCLAIIEGMANCLSILCPDEGYHLTYIEKNKNAYLYKANNKSSFINSLRFLLNNREIRYFLGKNAYYTALKYKQEDIGRRWYVLYNNLIMSYKK